MALQVAANAATLCIRRTAYEQSGLMRAAIDARLGLTDEEFRVEGDLVVIGPIYGVLLDEMFGQLDQLGLRHFDDYFELSGNWPEWLTLFVSGA